MSTKTRPACKIRSGDTIDFGGEPATVREAHVWRSGFSHVYFSFAGDVFDIFLPSDLLLNVQRSKRQAEPTIKDDPDAAPMPSVDELNAAFAESIRRLDIAQVR